MREQGQISTWSLPHRLSSNGCGSETAQNATWLRYQGVKRQVNVRSTPCEQAVIPFPSGIFVGENKAKEQGNSFSFALL